MSYLLYLCDSGLILLAGRGGARESCGVRVGGAVGGGDRLDLVFVGRLLRLLSGRGCGLGRLRGREEVGLGGLREGATC